VLAAGANDLVDSAPCDGSSCDLTPDIGISGIYFSLNEGASWVQPTYTGLTARSGTPQVGDIHTLPWYFENGMSSHGDPALAFGPQPGPGGFSWANGSRLYYANLAFPIPGRAPFNGGSAVAVSRAACASSALPGSGRRGPPGVPVPLDCDQDLLGIGYAAEHHHRAAPAGQQRSGSDQQQGPGRTLAKRGGGVVNEGDGAATEGGLDSGALR
jgi:hypothetical protein